LELSSSTCSWKGFSHGGRDVAPERAPDFGAVIGGSDSEGLDGTDSVDRGNAGDCFNGGSFCNQILNNMPAMAPMIVAVAPSIAENFIQRT